MSDLIVLVPTRGRPQAAVELLEAFDATCTAETFVAFVVDADDPLRDDYTHVVEGASRVDGPGQWLSRRAAAGVLVTPSTTMVEALNFAAIGYATTTPVAVAFLGDDHRPRTKGWDTAYLEALRELGTGIVYGNDLLQQGNLPTQCAMTSDIVRALGWMAPPMLRHLYVDNFWRDLGRATNCIRYLPDVVVEHLHPVAGKAAVDEGYERVNAPSVYQADEAAYRRFASDGGMQAATEAVAALRVAETATHAHEWRLFPEGTVPEYTRPEWYAGREHAPHLEQAGHRARLLNTATFVAQAAFTLGVNTVVDIGSGDGGLLSLLGPALRGWGYDLMPANVEASARRGVDVRLGDAVDGDIEWGDIAVCTEMLEHLVDPHNFLRKVASNVKALVCSSPFDERPGAAYEFHTWAWDLDGYRALVEQAGFKVIRQRPVDRFQVLLAVRNHDA